MPFDSIHMVQVDLYVKRVESAVDLSSDPSPHLDSWDSGYVIPSLAAHHKHAAKRCD